MTIDQPPYPLPAQLEGHEHEWDRVDVGESPHSWAYRCTTCGRTWAGFEA